MDKNDTPTLDFSSLLASSIHDMKNSLGIVLSKLEHIGQVCDPQQCGSVNDITHIRYEGSRLNSNLIHLLALYRIDSSQYVLNIAENEVDEFAEEICLHNQDLLESKQITIESACSEDTLWYFDRDLVLGVINSIVHNTYKYANHRVIIDAGIEDDYLAISVSDDGQGYPQSMLVEDAGAAAGINFKTGGTGLGLYFASHLASLHKNGSRRGYIKTSNDGIDGGSKFTMYLP